MEPLREQGVAVTETDEPGVKDRAWLFTWRETTGTGPLPAPDTVSVDLALLPLCIVMGCACACVRVYTRVCLSVFGEERREGAGALSLCVALRCVSVLGTRGRGDRDGRARSEGPGLAVHLEGYGGRGPAAGPGHSHRRPCALAPVHHDGLCVCERVYMQVHGAWEGGWMYV